MIKLLISIFSRVWLIVSAPHKAWKEISGEKSDNGQDQTLRHLYTLMIICAGAAFVAALVYRDGFHFIVALLKGTIVGLSLLISFWGTYYLFLGGLKKYFHLLPDKRSCLQLLGYSYSIILVVSIFTALLPGLFFLKIVNVYTLYIVWEGVGIYFNFDEKSRGNLVLLLSAGIIILPYALEQALGLILSITNF